MLRTLLRLLFGATRSTEPNPLNTMIRATRPDPTEAEVDRYTRYHNATQHGR